MGPGIGGSEWEAGVHTRVVMFRDFGGRFVGVQKVNGRNLYPLDPTSDVRNVVGFEITKEGELRERVVDLTSSPVGNGNVGGGMKKEVPAPAAGVVARKRVFDEIADSEEDEDVDEYGWAEKDDEDVIIVDPPPVDADATAKVLVAEQKDTENPAIEEQETIKPSESASNRNHE